VDAVIISDVIRTVGPRCLAILPRQIVVLVRIPGCSSLAVRAKKRSISPLIVRSDSLPMTVSTALTVCSRTTGAISVNPEVYSIVQHSLILQSTPSNANVPSAGRSCRLPSSAKAGRSLGVGCQVNTRAALDPDWQIVE
jgi:hypothetical protein